MKIGFTGSRGGMTLMQRASVEALVRKYRPAEIHHGGCKGSDEEFDNMCHELVAGGHMDSSLFVVVHPSSLKGWRGTWGPGRVLDERPPLERNHDIVDAVELMIATPKGVHEVLRSGTWSCVRYARSKRKDIYIVWPDGRVKGELYSRLPGRVVEVKY